MYNFVTTQTLESEFNTLETDMHQKYYDDWISKTSR